MYPVSIGKILVHLWYKVDIFPKNDIVNLIVCACGYITGCGKEW